MRKQVSYLCRKIDELSTTKLYSDYCNEYEKLQKNPQYQQLRSKIMLIDKEANKKEYFALKSEIYSYEKAFREKEKEINIYLNYMIKQYNKLLYRNDLDKKKGNYGNNG